MLATLQAVSEVLRELDAPQRHLRDPNPEPFDTQSVS